MAWWGAHTSTHVLPFGCDPEPKVIDTPGILDHELDKRNAIEMQSITALAHLPCCVLFFVDISEHCGYPIAQQLALFRQIKPLFAGKQVARSERASRTRVRRRCPREKNTSRQSSQVMPPWCTHTPTVQTERARETNQTKAKNADYLRERPSAACWTETYFP